MVSLTLFLENTVSQVCAVCDIAIFALLVYSIVVEISQAVAVQCVQ